MVQDRTGTIHEAVAHLCPFVLELLQLYRYLTDAPTHTDLPLRCRVSPGFARQEDLSPRMTMHSCSIVVLSWVGLCIQFPNVFTPREAPQSHLLAAS